MDTVSLQTKRPARDEPSSTGASAAHGRSMAKRACPDSGADAATWSGGDEDSHSDASVESEWSGGVEDAESECSTDDEDAKSETGSPAISVLDWSDTTPAESLTIEVRIPRRTWAWLQTWTLKDVKAMRP